MLDTFLLFGDSITQQSSLDFSAALADAYIRRLDVCNRGLSGYNTSQALQVLPQIIPTPGQTKLRLLTVFFGANDARLPDTPGPAQSVDLQQYGENLHKIINHPALRAHSGLRIILITPPPVDERAQERLDREKYPGWEASRRTASNNKRYRDRALEVAELNNVACLDLWSVMMHTVGWNGNNDELPGSKALPRNEKLCDLLSDGLHFAPLGYKLLYNELMGLIARNWPDQLPDHLPFILPRWDDEVAWPR